MEGQTFSSEAPASVSFDAKFDAVMAGGGALQTDQPQAAQTEAPIDPPVAPEGDNVSVPEGAASGAEQDQNAAGTEAAPEGEAQQEPDQAEASPEEYAAGEQPDVPGMTPTRWGRYQGAYKFSKALAQALNGIDPSASLDPSALPSVDEVVQYRDGFLKHAQVEASFLSGNPVHAQEFVQHWNQSSPEAMAVVAEQMQGVLAQTNTPAYQRLAVPVVNRFLDGMYAAAQAQTDPQSREALSRAAQVAEWHLTGGNYRQFDASKPVDPVSQRESEIEQKYQRVQQYERQVEQQLSSEWNQRVDNTITEQALQSKVDAKLEPLKSMYAKTPKVFEALRDKFISDVRKAADSNPQSRVFNIKYDQLLRSRGNEQLLNDVVAQYGSIVDRAISLNLPDYFRSASANVTAQQAQRTAQLQRAASRQEPSTGGAPKQQSMTPNLNEIKSLEGKIDALLGIAR